MEKVIFKNDGTTPVTAEFLNDLQNKIYPVGSIYLSVNTINPSTIFGGTWEKVGVGRCLMGASNDSELGTTVDSGLPNITGKFGFSSRLGKADMDSRTSGAFTYVNQNEPAMYTDGNDVGGYINFNASNSNSIYGKSNIVQPPALKVYFWERIA